MYYKTIYECPILNFQHVIEFKDTRYLLKKYDNNSKEDLTHVYETLNSQIIDEFGLTEISQLIFHKTKELTRLKNKYIISEDESLITGIEIAEKQLNRLVKQSNGNENDIRKIHATNHRIISNWSGRDSRKLTVFEYYNDFRDFEKESNIKPYARRDKKRLVN